GNTGSLDMHAYHELWIDYRARQRLGQHGVLARLDVTEAGTRSSAKTVALAEGFGASVAGAAQIEDVARVEWTPRNYLYIAKRKLGLSTQDTQWHYLQDRENAVLQRRLHHDIQGIEALELLVAPGTRVHANVRLRVEGDAKREDIVVWSEMPKYSDVAASGQTRVGLSLASLVRERYPDHAGKIYLEELIVFIRGNVARVVEERPLHALRWVKMTPAARRAALALQDETNNQGRRLWLGSQTRVLPDGGYRILIDLRPLTMRPQAGFRCISLTQGRLLVPAADGGTPVDIEITDVRLVAVRAMALPFFAQQGELLLRDWGIADDRRSGDAGTVWPLVERYLSLDGDAAKAVHAETATSAAAGAAASRLRFKGIDVSSPRAGLRVSPGEGGVSVSGFGPRVDLYWRFRTVLRPHSFFYVTIAAGAANVRDLEITPLVEGRRLPSVSAEPGQAVRLPAAVGEIDGLHVRLHMKTADAGVVLKELVLFRPQRISFTQALGAALPAHGG